MDIENVKVWACQPDVCRCCLSASGTWDLLAAYISNAGEKLIYSEVLQSCFGISLSFLSEWSPGRLLCELCAERLHNANAFKTQVLEAEKHFTIYVNNRKDIVDESIVKVSTNNESLEDAEIFDGNSKTKNTSESYDIQNNSESGFEDDSLRNYTELNNSEINEYKPLIEENAAVIPSKVPKLLRPVKQISERKRIKTTCEVILKGTTACPFRHHKSWFQCFFCPQTFMDISTLKNHTIQTHGNIEHELNNMKRYPRSLQINISELRCRSCNECLDDVEAMRLHFMEIHDQVIYKECIADYKVNCSPYSCHLCSQEFHVFRTLTTHLNEHYANFICAICGKSFINSKRLKVHNRTHESGTFPCAECGKVLKTKTSKANHMESHSKRIIKCQICSKPMKHYNDRIKHMSEVHDITHTFKCPICAREYTIKHYLATHIRQTHGNKNKKCLECGMAFITNHGLKKHMQKHSSLKAFSCGICNKSYARSNSLREHMRIHDDKD